jgi:hypothetical protein
MNIFSKMGRALSIFGVSNPEDIRKMQEKRTQSGSLEPRPSKNENPDRPSEEEEGKTES